jgi:hypothetical protein
MPATTWTRRDLLTAGALGLGLNLGDVLRAEAAKSASGAYRPRVRNVIFLHQFGGPSHIDTFDMKPEHANGGECEIFTDSEFWINVITKWSLTWEANGWQKKGGIKNLDLVQEVCPLYRSSRAKLTWVRGHVGDPGNEMADQWANKARIELLNR